MRRHNVLSIALTVMFFFSFSLCSDAADKQRPAKSPQALYKEIMLHLDEIEQHAPKCQISVYKTRDALNKLYSHISGDLTDPFDIKGNLTVPDLEKGATMYDRAASLRDEALKKELLSLVNNHVSVGYQRAQDLIFSDLDNRAGYVECVYTGRKLKTSGEPDATNMNVEHSWPQSKGAVGIAKCDLHHLFPADSKANGIRGNNPFSTISNPAWEQGGSKSDGDSFEVRKEQRGNTARGMFYFAIRYGMRIADDEETTLRKWHKEDPVDELEMKRNDRVQNFQNNRNPFVDKPEYVDQISDF
ncbi:MAG TPA: endonuclease [Candidatus Rifleibacterium sp.]|nr:endonuclease [Candidatus Rifleibacterium sp.]